MKAVTPVGWSPCRPRTIQLPLTLPHVAGSPVLGVLSVSMTSTRSSNPSHLIGLAGPTSLRLNRMDLPCSRCFLWLHAWRYEPREHLRPLALSRPAIPPSPLRDRVSYSDHNRFRGYFPVHFIRPTTSLSTLRSGRYRTPRKTRFAAAR